MKLSMIKLSLALAGVVLAAGTPARAASPLKAGDRVVFLGDSITEQRMHTRYVMNYFTLRYPGLDVTFRNAGWSGDTSSGGLNRLQRDVLSLNPTVVTICFGMNDGNYTAFDQSRYDRFMQGMTGLVAQLKSAKVRIVLLGPGCVDPDLRAEGAVYNATLKRYSDGVKALAEKEKVAFIGLHDLMIDAQTKAKAKNPAYTMIPDSVHPNEPGQAVMAYAMLKALGCKDQASGLEIDAAAAKAAPDRCQVSDLKVTEKAITFTRADEAFPTAMDGGANSILEFVPFTQELNQYNFKVAGLKAGNWKLNVAGIEVGTFSDKDLAAGVNLAVRPGPWQKLGEQVNELSSEQEHRYFYLWRELSVPHVAIPVGLKPEVEVLIVKAGTLVDQAEAARIKAVAKDLAWQWSLTLVP